MESQRIIQVEEKVPFNLLVPLSIQHMFAMFGASILVPFIFGISPAVVLFMNGVGTCCLSLSPRERPPLIWLQLCISGACRRCYQQFRIRICLGGFVVVGFCGCILAFIVYKFGTKWIDVVLPPAAMGL